MIEGNRFAVPPEIEEILDHLPLHVTLNVPDHILSIWFPPGPVDGRMEGPALARASLCAELRMQIRPSPRDGRRDIL